jgi:hypothetical protein
MAIENAYRREPDRYIFCGGTPASSLAAIRNHSDCAIPRWSLLDVPQRAITAELMAYLKSILAGTLAFVLFAILFNVMALYVVTRLHTPQMSTSPPAPVPASNNSEPGFDLTTTWVDYRVPEWPSLLAGVTAFALGFHWTLRRSRTRRQ